MKHLGILFIFALITGCVTEKVKRISIMSEPVGADISMNDEYLGRAPVTKILMCRCAGDFCDNDYNWKPNGINFKATPNSKTGSGEVQYLRVSPCTDDDVSKALLFNMSLQSAPKKNQIDLNIKNNGK